MVNCSQISKIMETDPRKKYYVYRLVDPRNLQTFYVGKGCGDRVCQHVNNVISMKKEKDEDLVSLKAQQISEIISSGKEVICIIHRRGLSEYEAFEVEAALIDAYPGLTNQQLGHGMERGCISLDDLLVLSGISEYNEPSEDYVIIKTTPNGISANGNLYEATRRSWRAKLSKAQNYKYVLAVVYGVVREVYEVDKWYQDGERIAFEGHVSQAPISIVKGKLIPDKYKKKGAANPFIYKKK